MFSDAFFFHQQGQIEVDSETTFKLAALILQVRTDKLPFTCSFLFVNFCELPATLKLLHESVADRFLRQLFANEKCEPPFSVLAEFA